MVINGHLVGEDALVNHAAVLTAIGGTLHLTHVEDDAVFERYLDVISKIPEIDTDVARETIQEQLLREPSVYIDSQKPPCARPVWTSGWLSTSRTAIVWRNTEMPLRIIRLTGGLAGPRRGSTRHECHSIFSRRGAAYHSC